MKNKKTPISLRLLRVSLLVFVGGIAFSMIVPALLPDTPVFYSRKAKAIPCPGGVPIPGVDCTTDAGIGAAPTATPAPANAAPAAVLPGITPPTTDVPGANDAPEGETVGACGAKIGTPPTAAPAAGDDEEAADDAPAAEAPKASPYCTPFNESNPATARGSDNGNEFLRKYVTPAIKAMSALAGIAVTASVVFGGIQYATAGGDSGKVAAAKKRILEAIFILFAYIFFYAFMRWLLPGGIPG